MADSCAADLLPGAVDYTSALAAATARTPTAAAAWSPDDQYVLYTGGTTGLPKGVVWREADIFAAILDGRAGGATPEHSDPLAGATLSCVFAAWGYDQ